MASFYSMSVNAGIFRDWKKTEISDIKTQVRKTNNRTINNFKDIRNTVIKNTKSGLSVLTPKIKKQINQIITDLPKILAKAEQADKISAFLGNDNACGTSSECYQFKDNLKMYFNKTHALSVGLSSIYNSPISIEQLNSEQLINLIDWAPPKVLYPLYLMLGGIINQNTLDSLEDTITNLDVFSVVFTRNFNTTTQAGGSSSQSSLDDDSSFQSTTCNIIKTNFKPARNASYAIAGFGAGLRIVGGALKLAGESYVAGPTEKDVGIHGYVHMSIKNNWLKMFGIGADTSGELLMAVGNYGFNKINYCRLLINQEKMYAKLNNNIELALSSCTATVSLILPEDKGGEFNTAMNIVENRIDQLNELGLDTHKAYKYWQRAQDKSYQGYYGKSFRTLCKSYNALVDNSIN